MENQNFLRKRLEMLTEQQEAYKEVIAIADKAIGTLRETRDDLWSEWSRAEAEAKQIRQALGAN